MKLKLKHNFLPITVFLLLILWTASLYTQSRVDREQGETSLNKVYQSILDQYVAEIDPEKLSNAAIKGMLHELDPYSQYINDNNAYRLDAITTGEYGGVGINLGRMNDSLVVISPMDGTPAFRQGILAGDRIIQIDSIWTRKLDLDEAAKLVRGKKGSALTMLIKRNGESELLSFELERELIRVPDISYSGLLRDRTGYVKVSNFSKYSAEDLEKAIRKLNKTHLNALIIDLRGNPGGLLSAALMSADLFVEKGRLLLETKGRVSKSNRKYYARRGAIVNRDLPLGVLVDGGSASASEILAGILQDYDRAVVIGQSSYGKGLVQTVTRLSPETRLKLTTAKYYLPSGRLIQKREIAADVLYEDLLEVDKQSAYSDNHRRFESGGGVAPDLEVADLEMSSLERNLWRKRLFFKYALTYGAEHPGLTLPFEFDGSQVDSFYIWLNETHAFPATDLHRWIKKSNTLIDSSSSIYPEMQKLLGDLENLESGQQQEEIDRYRTQILIGLETEIANIIGGNGARVAASLKHDPVVVEAIKVLSAEDELQSILTQTSN